MSFEDRILTCQECGDSFTFSADDQAYHADKGYTNDPKRCPACRLARRNTGSGGGSGNGRAYGRREMHPAVCAECGKDTMVPFQPRGDRPIYCGECYSRRGGFSQRNRY